MSFVPDSQVIFRFFKPMVPGFHKKLCLPPLFGMKMKGEFPEEAFLTSNLGKYRVKIGLCSEGKICFLDGWANFVKIHDLKTGEFVYFEQTAHDQFQIIVYDSSCCCKEVHVKEEEEEKSPAPNNGRGKRRSRNNAAFVKQEVFASEVHETEPTLGPNLDEDAKVLKKRGRGRPRKRALSPEHREPSVEIFEERNLFSHTVTKRGRGRPRKATQSLHQGKTLHHNMKKEFPEKTDDEKEPSEKYVQQHDVQRRGRLPDGVARDMEQNHFLQKIMPYNIGSCFILYIPQSICRSNCISKNTRINLRGPSKDWCDARAKKHSLGRLCIVNGWRDFCASNNIKLGDLCLFRIIKNIKNDARAMSESIVMDVKVSKTSA